MWVVAVLRRAPVSGLPRSFRWGWGSGAPVERPCGRVDLDVPAELVELLFEVGGLVRDFDDPVGGAIGELALDGGRLLAFDELVGAVEFDDDPYDPRVTCAACVRARVG